MFPTLLLGPLVLPVPPLILLLGVWVGVELTERHAAVFGVKADELNQLVLTALLAGVIGARLFYALQSPQAFLASPLSLFSPRPQMLDLSGGLLAGLLAALIVGQRKRISLWPALDGLTTLLAVMAVALGLANLASGDAFGAPARLPWAIYQWSEWRHPSQVYETAAALGILSAAWPGGWLARRAVEPGAAGLRFWVFAALSAGARLFLEAFRGDSILLLERFRLAQVAAWVVLAVSLWQIGLRIQREKEISWIKS